MVRRKKFILGRNLFCYEPRVTKRCKQSAQSNLDSNEFWEMKPANSAAIDHRNVTNSGMRMQHQLWPQAASTLHTRYCHSTDTEVLSRIRKCFRIYFALSVAYDAKLASDQPGLSWSSYVK